MAGNSVKNKGHSTSEASSESSPEESKLIFFWPLLAPCVGDFDSLQSMMFRSTESLLQLGLGLGLGLVTVEIFRSTESHAPAVLPGWWRI